MRKRIRKVILLILVLTLLLIPNLSFAASKPSVSISGVGSFTVGKTYTVTIKYSNTESADFNVEYDKEYLEYVSASTDFGVYNHEKSDGIVKFSTATASKTYVTGKVKFKAKKAGSTNIVVVTKNVEGENPANKKGAITIKNPEASKDNGLDSITLSDGILFPTFDSSIYSYSVDVENSIDEMLITFKTSDSKAKAKISGDSKLNVGENKRTITVTAQSGDTKKYEIVINRATEDGTLPDGTNYYEVVKKKALTVKSFGTEFLVEDDNTKIVIPNGFTLSSGEYNGYEIPVITSKTLNKKLIYLVEQLESVEEGTENKSGWYYIDLEKNKIEDSAIFTSNDLIKYTDSLLFKEETKDDDNNDKEFSIDPMMIYIISGTLALLLIALIVLQISNLRYKNKLINKKKNVIEENEEERSDS